MVMRPCHRTSWMGAIRSNHHTALFFQHILSPSEPDHSYFIFLGDNRVYGGLSFTRWHRKYRESGGICDPAVGLSPILPLSSNHSVVASNR